MPLIIKHGKFVMKTILILLTAFLCCSEAAAKCTYSPGDPKRVSTLISPKIPLDASVPVGTVLYTKKIGTGSYKSFQCSQLMQDQYIVASTGAEIPGVVGMQGKPVYATGIDGIGFQVSDLLSSKNGSLIPAVAGSTLVPLEKYNSEYQYVTIWLIKTKPVIDTSNNSFNETVTFSVGNPVTNPVANDRLLVSVNLKSGTINYKETSCDISVSGSSQVTLKKIEKSELMSVTRGGATSAQKNITMKVSCPKDSIGNTVTYWFNPIGGASKSGNGVIDNMLTGATAASNVGIIIKKDNTPVTFYDLNNSYKFSKAQDIQYIDLTADYYRITDNAENITAGNVKAVMEVIIQEE